MHISDIKHYERCERMFWLCEYEPQAFQPFVYFNESMSELIKQYFHLCTYFEGTAGDDPQLALDAMCEETTLLNARFAKDGLRIKIPLMRKETEGWVIYFSYATCYPRESEAQKLADTLSVLDALGITYYQVLILHLNADYVRGDQLNVQDLLVITPYLYNKKNKAHTLAIDLIHSLKRDVFAFLPRMREVLSMPEAPVKEEGTICMKGGKCRYYDTCFPDHTNITSVLNLMQTSHKYDLIKAGYEDMKDIDVDLLEGTRLQYAQLMAARNGGFYLDRFAVNDWVKTCIHGPISYLDFEWETYAFPPYQGMKPYDVLVFQYSLHVESVSDGTLTHYEYIGEGDCRIAFIEHLLRDLPREGTILVFNMEGAEKLRLKQLAAQFPQYQVQLDEVCERMVDLALPFETGNIYDSRMKGYYSLKKLVEVFSDYDYHSLDISQGLEAARSWRMLADAEEEDAENIRKALYKYCAMDTYAEYIIFHKILSFLENTARA